MTYHPDRNPAGNEMMQLVNAAFEALKDFTGNIDPDGVSDSTRSYPEDVNIALNTIINLMGLNIEICGAWIWVDGDTYPHKDVLKGAKFKFAGKKKRWYFRPEDWKSVSRGTFDMDDIRDKYGSDTPKSGVVLALD